MGERGGSGSTLWGKPACPGARSPLVPPWAALGKEEPPPKPSLGLPGAGGGLRGAVIAVFLMTCKPPLYMGPEYIKYFSDKTIDVSILPLGRCRGALPTAPH